MAKQIQLRRGTEAENKAFTGALAELTMDTTNNRLRLHDGVTAGGHSVTTTQIATIIIMPVNSVPTGFLECNGAELSRTTYADLFSAIGTTYGAGNGSTTFNIPDLRGEFIRGFDNGRGVDNGRVLGSFQNHSFEQHDHQVNQKGDRVVQTSRPIIEDGTTYQAEHSTGYQAYRNYLTSIEGGNETRPRNVAMMYCIKY